MLRNASDLKSFSLEATDGTLGKVKDLLFDDLAWTVRYAVADSRRFLPGRLVLISPESLRSPDTDEKSLPVQLSEEQVKQSPGIQEDRPVSRQQQEELHRYYGWMPYWAGPAPLFAAPATPEQADATARALTEAGPGSVEEDDPHLRSMNEVLGYGIRATDGEIGHVEDFILDDDAWVLRWIVVDTRNWLPGKKVLIAPTWVEGVDWGESKLAIDLGRKEVEQSPPYSPETPVDRDHESRIYDHYGRPTYWE